MKSFLIGMDPEIKAFVFDVLGTTVDWRSSVIAELKKAEVKYGLEQGENDIFSIQKAYQLIQFSIDGYIGVLRSH